MPAAPAASPTTRPAQHLAPITWDRGRPLTWQDFAGQVPEDKAQQGFADRLAAAAGLGRKTYEAAETASAISKATYHYSYNCTSQSGSPTRCLLTSADVEPIHAEFDPDKSWVIPEGETADLLQHEQGHFDIAALYAANMEGELRTALTAQTGKLHHEAPDQQAAAAAIKADLEATVGEVRDRVLSQFDAEQDRYDAETRHGTDAAQQRRWTSQLNSKLRG
jgi:hypothetical protein